MTITDRLAEFAMRQWALELPAEVQHECKRLLLNNLAASAAAVGNPVLCSVMTWASSRPGTSNDATVFWRNGSLASEHAALVNNMGMDILDFSETHLGVILHGISSIASAVLADAETRLCSGLDVLKAVAIGFEIEVGVASALRPSIHTRGLDLMSARSAGAAAACCLLRGMDQAHTATAIGLALLTGTGVWENLGSTAHAYSAGCSARDALIAADMSGRGLDVAPTVFEGRQGLLGGYSSEPLEKAEAIIDSLGEHWEVLNNNYKTFPTETISQAPLQGLLDIASGIPEDQRRAVQAIRIRVSPRVAEVEQHRYSRFGKPQTPLQAQFDQRYCVAAGWLAGRFGPDEKLETAFTNSETLALRERIELIPDASISLHDGAAVEVVLSDNLIEERRVEHFHGTLSDRLSDDEVITKFMNACVNGMPRRTGAGRIVDSVFALEEVENIQELTRLLT